MWLKPALLVRVVQRNRTKRLKVFTEMEKTFIIKNSFTQLRRLKNPRSIVSNLETQVIWWYNSILKASECETREDYSVLIQRQERTYGPAQRQSSRRKYPLSPEISLFSLFRLLTDWMRSTYMRKGNLHLLIQMLISSRNPHRHT